jgi:hypothetical protein
MLPRVVFSAPLSSDERPGDQCPWNSINSDRVIRTAEPADKVHDLENTILRRLVRNLGSQVVEGRQGYMSRDLGISGLPQQPNNVTERMIQAIADSSYSRIRFLVIMFGTNGETVPRATLETRR